MTTPTWQERLEEVYALMHEMSCQTEPQAMVKAYGERVRAILPIARRISISRRDLSRPWYRVTRYSEWEDDINPWTQKEKLPLLKGGIFAELIYSNRPQIIDQLQVPDNDPAAEYLAGQGSLMAIPMLDGGEALNMVITTQTEEFGFNHETLPDVFWQANLFGRATHNLVLKADVEQAYQTIDRELKIVSGIQRSLLPKQMPEIPGLQLAAHYQTSQRAGGDYYDFFRLSDTHWGILIADVSGHGTPAAVVMAITHSIAHLFPNRDCSPSHLLQFVNEHLCERYTSGIEAFVTAFYAVYDSKTRTLTYSRAGHNPPRVWKCKQQRAIELDDAGGMPLGLFPETEFPEASLTLDVGDRLVLYTDGITEAQSPAGALFSTGQLDRVVNRSCQKASDDLVSSIVRAVDNFTEHASPTDDRTLVVGTVT